MSDEVTIISNINIAYIHAVTAAALTKICLDKKVDIPYIFLSWLPILNLSTIAMLSKRSFGDVFFSLLALNIVGFIFIASMSGVFIETPVLFFIVLTILSCIQGIIVWEEIISSGGFKNSTILSIICGAPIISLFALIYVAFKGNWD